MGLEVGEVIDDLIADEMGGEVHTVQHVAGTESGHSKDFRQLGDGVKRIDFGLTNLFSSLFLFFCLWLFGIHRGHSF